MLGQIHFIMVKKRQWSIQRSFSFRIYLNNLFQETHILHEFPEDFYGETLSIVLLGEIRKMTTFKNTSIF